MDNVKKLLVKNKKYVVIILLVLIIVLVSIIIALSMRTKEYKHYLWCVNDKPGVYIEYTNTYAKLVGDSKYLVLKEIPISVWDRYKDDKITRDNKQMPLANEITNDYIVYTSDCGRVDAFAVTKAPTKDWYNTGFIIPPRIRFYN